MQIERSPLPQAIDRELADLAAAVYNNEVQQVGRWMRTYDALITTIPAGAGPTSRPDPTSGFRAAVFSHEDGTHALAFCGSERETRDWLTNFAQGLGVDTAQYRQAAAFAQECKVQFGDNFVLTGHSLGGGLAAIAAAVSNTPAVTFNPAGVHNKTLQRAGIDPDAFREAAEAGMIRKYVVRGEILDLVNKLPLVPGSHGARIDLEDPRKAWSVGKHSMGAVTRSMDAIPRDQHVTAPESALGQPQSYHERIALAFRTQPKESALKTYPGLETAYRVLEAAEAGMAKVASEHKTKLMAALQDNLGKRITAGETIRAPKAAELGHAVIQGPER